MFNFMSYFVVTGYTDIRKWKNEYQIQSSKSYILSWYSFLNDETFRCFHSLKPEGRRPKWHTVVI